MSLTPLNLLEDVSEALDRLVHNIRAKAGAPATAGTALSASQIWELVGPHHISVQKLARMSPMLIYGEVTYNGGAAPSALIGQAQRCGDLLHALVDYHHQMKGAYEQHVGPDDATPLAQLHRYLYQTSSEAFRIFAKGLQSHTGQQIRVHTTQEEVTTADRTVPPAPDVAMDIIGPARVALHDLALAELDRGEALEATLKRANEHIEKDIAARRITAMSLSAIEERVNSIKACLLQAHAVLRTYLQHFAASQTSGHPLSPWPEWLCATFVHEARLAQSSYRQSELLFLHEAQVSTNLLLSRFAYLKVAAGAANHFRSSLHFIIRHRDVQTFPSAGLQAVYGVRLTDIDRVVGIALQSCDTRTRATSRLLHPTTPSTCKVRGASR